MTFFKHVVWGITSARLTFRVGYRAPVSYRPGFVRFCGNNREFLDLSLAKLKLSSICLADVTHHSLVEFAHSIIDIIPMISQLLI